MPEYKERMRIMPEAKREFLIREAKMQTKALQRLGIWKRAALSMMVIGGILAYTGFVPDFSILGGVLGIATAAVSGIAALLIGMGCRRGKRNVENILKAAAEI